MTEKEKIMAKTLGLTISKMNVPCPVCAADEPMLEQDLCSFGDEENRLFCPHCELEVDLILEIY